MNPKCARCDKTVYPMEKLNCLDKFWHKACFTCETCNMKLTMKNYKGYNKNPYCVAHYPTTKFTAVADTPENLRLKKNTEQQSLLEYHKQFEQAKGQYTPVADDPETKRALQNTQISSNIVYQGGASEQSRLGVKVRPGQVVKGHNPPGERSTAKPPAQAQYKPPAPVPAPAPKPTSGPRYRALYDYAAADDDEVSFNEGDIIIDAKVIDEGWMEGRVQRTGAYGMLPANYVETS